MGVLFYRHTDPHITYNLFLFHYKLHLIYFADQLDIMIYAPELYSIQTHTYRYYNILSTAVTYRRVLDKIVIIFEFLT